MYPNKWFEELGMHLKSQESHNHWFAVKGEYAFLEEPCTDPYARFCERNAASIPYFLVLNSVSAKAGPVEIRNSVSQKVHGGEVRGGEGH